jgi:hypothetical protein
LRSAGLDFIFDSVADTPDTVIDADAQAGERATSTAGTNESGVSNNNVSPFLRTSVCWIEGISPTRRITASAASLEMKECSVRHVGRPIGFSNDKGPVTGRDVTGRLLR